MGFPVAVGTIVLTGRVFKFEAEVVWAGLQSFQSLVKERFLRDLVDRVYPKSSAFMRAAAVLQGRLWKLELSRLASETGLSIRVCHFPPGTSKWNKIEHRLFSFITMNWRGRPLISHEVIVQLIANTKTKRGLTVHAEIDSKVYPKGLAVSDAEFDSIRLDRDEFHGDWNYVISPN